MDEKMKMIFIYGPPASGKLTVAKELAGQTGFRLIDNHQATDYLLNIFPREKPKFEVPRARLGRKIRLLIYETAANEGVSLVTTFAPLAEGAHDYIKNAISAVETAGGEFCLVQLMPTITTIQNRVAGESRTGGKVRNRENLRQLIKKYPIMFEKFANSEHLVLDNSDMEPAEAARRIMEFYKIKRQI